MSLMITIEEATREGRDIAALYSRLRTGGPGSERAELLRRAGEHADSLGQRLQRLAEQQRYVELDEDMREALDELSEAMEQVMVQEREYRMSCGAPPDARDGLG